MTESNDIQVKEQLNIRLVLDRSGSMSSCKEETVVSINEYINEIQKEAVEGIFTLSTKKKCFLRLIWNTHHGKL